MDGYYFYNPEIWPSIISMLFLSFLSVYSWTRRDIPGAIPFTIGCSTAIPIGFSQVMTLSAGNPELKIFWYMFETTWLVICVTAMTCFILEYSMPGRWLTTRNLVLLSIPPTFSILFNFTNQYNHLAFTGFTVDKIVIPHYGPIGWMFLVYLLSLSVIDWIVFIWLFRVSRQHRWPVVLMMSAHVLTRVFYLSSSVVNDTWLIAVPEYSLVYLAYAVALFAFKIFDPISLASHSVMNQMTDGVLVLDTNEEIVSLNPAAEKMLNLSTKDASGINIRKIFSGISKTYASGPQNIDSKMQQLNNSTPYFSESTVNINNAPGETNTATTRSSRFYTLNASSLNDWRGKEVGQLLILQDITERKQAQENLVEQQRVLAMAQERDYLARELHDSIGQVLGYTGFQLDAAAKLLHDGKIDTAVSHLNRLSGVIREAHADVRGLILDLRSEPVTHDSFCVSLRNYLDGFTNNYGIQSTLNVDESIISHLSKEMQMHVFRIIQEALTNARKHSQARSIQVQLSKVNNHFNLIIEDDGIGFDPVQVNPDDKIHYGLHFMRERAEKIGGKLFIDSETGKGARVIVNIPLSEGAM